MFPRVHNWIACTRCLIYTSHYYEQILLIPTNCRMNKTLFSSWLRLPLGSTTCVETTIFSIFWGQFRLSLIGIKWHALIESTSGNDQYTLTRTYRFVYFRCSTLGFKIRWFVVSIFCTDASNDVTFWKLWLKLFQVDMTSFTLNYTWAPLVKIFWK